jgi:hypothetical protein
MSIGLKGNADGSGAIQIGGTDAIAIDTSQIVTMNGGTGGLVSLTSKAYNWNGVTTNAFIDFTGIPSWVKRITVMFLGVSTSGTSPPMIQIGSGSAAITGYLGTNTITGTTAVSANFTTGFGIGVSTSQWISTPILHGSIIISLLSSTTNTWVASGVTSNSASPVSYQTSGSVPLSGALDRVRITTLGGVQTFAAGSINILYE